jgi:phosphohistidine phosphatase SixA
MRLRPIWQAAIVACAMGMAGCESPEERAASQLFKQLQSGDVILYMRHAPTEQKKEAQSGPFEDCTWQRVLTDEGRKLAADLGTAVASLKLPIAVVLSSPMCRAMDTAKAVFGSATPEVALKLNAKGPDGKIDVSPIKRLFTRAPPKSRLIAIVGHETPELGFAPQLREGETAVIRPKPDGYEVLGRIPPGQWGKWAKEKAGS